MSYPGVAPSGYIYQTTNNADINTFSPLAGDASGVLTANRIVGLRGIKIQEGTPPDHSVLHFIAGHNEWRYLPDTSGSSSSSPHKLLGSTHTDTTDNSPTRGALVYGSGASTTWNALPKGSNGAVLQYDANDVLTGYLGNQTPFTAASSGTPSVTFLNDTDTGLYQRTIDRAGIAASGRGLMEWSAPDLATLSLGGQVLNSRMLTGAGALTKLDHIAICNFANGTVTLPTGITPGRQFIIKNGDGTVTQSTPITIDGGGILIDGNFTIRISNPYGSYTLIYNGSQYNII